MGETGWLGRTACKEPLKIVAGELPLERLGNLPVVLLEGQDAIGEGLSGIEVIGAHTLQGSDHAS